MPIELTDLQVNVYLLDFYDNGLINVTLERVPQKEGADLWAIRERGYCLNKQGQWEFEPMPSGRTDEFLESCRWETAEQALAFWQTNNCKSLRDHYRR